MRTFALEITLDDNDSIRAISEAEKSDIIAFSVLVGDITEPRLPQTENDEETEDDDKLSMETLSVCCESLELEWIVMSAKETSIVSIGV